MGCSDAFLPKHPLIPAPLPFFSLYSFNTRLLHARVLVLPPATASVSAATTIWRWPCAGFALSSASSRRRTATTAVSVSLQIHRQPGSCCVPCALLVRSFALPQAVITPLHTHRRTHAHTPLSFPLPFRARILVEQFLFFSAVVVVFVC